MNIEEHYFPTEDEYFDPGAHLPVIAKLNKSFPPGATCVFACLKSFTLQLYLNTKCNLKTFILNESFNCVTNTIHQAKLESIRLSHCTNTV